MAKKKYKIYESIPRTPEERKWVEDQLNKERTPEELKKAILGLGRENSGAGWDVWFDKRIGAKLVSTGDEVYYKEVDEEGEYADNHFSELKRGFIDIIKQNPQDWEIKEYEVSSCMNRLPPGEEWKPRDLVVTNWGKEGNRCHYCHYKNGFTEEEWKEIKDSLSQQQGISSNIGKEQQDSYNSWTREQLIAEINRLKAEIESLKNNQILTSSERKERLQQGQQKLEKVQNIFNSKNTQQSVNNSSFAPLLVGGAALVVILVSVLFIKSAKKIKK